MSVIQLYLDEVSRFRWRFVNDDGDSLADGEYGYDEKMIVLGNIELFRQAVSTAVVINVDSGESPPATTSWFEQYQTASGQFQWRLWLQPGEIIAHSSSIFPSETELDSNIQQIQNSAGTAELDDQTIQGMAPFDLGPLPRECPISWPSAPIINVDIEVLEVPIDNQGNRNYRLQQANTRYIIRVEIDQLIIQASDVIIEVRGNGGIVPMIKYVLIDQQQQRIHIKGGRYERIELEVPAIFNGPNADYRPELMVEDVLIDEVEIQNTINSALMLRGKRIAVLRSDVQANHYSVWVGDTANFQSEDIILAGNSFKSAGPEATIRLNSVLRSVVVQNRLENPFKHNYRVHVRSDCAYAARNILLQAGLMIASMAEDEVGTAWFVDNILDHRTPSLLQVDVPPQSRLQKLHLTGNIIYSTVWDCFFCGEVPAGWVVEDNYIQMIREVN